ncbi:hypothetical protein AVEN_221837-1 [Araneus ventricosus]|uniref:Uncharacterized protein n=1 Tax=Araneus ventricosus TaxID=182803 RepID=A0A4Y2FVX8_ARAVE|nr:hypothetical protein AVEN_221837-1 [Araneus ventricosus]
MCVTTSSRERSWHLEREIENLEIPSSFESERSKVNAVLKKKKSIAAVRRDATPFTALSNISGVTADTCWRMATFNGDDGGLSRYAFDFKNTHNQKSQSVKSGELASYTWDYQCGTVLRHPHQTDVLHSTQETRDLESRSFVLGR